MTNRILPRSHMTMTARILGVIDGPFPAVDPHTGQLAPMGKRALAHPASSPFTLESIEYARLVGLTAGCPDWMADAFQRGTIRQHEGRPTMPPQPTCTHYQGVCEHVVCPRAYPASF